MHFLLHEPILAGTVLLCLAIVGGLVLSDWNAKRRARNLLKMRDGLREQYRQQTSGTPASTGVEIESPTLTLRDQPCTPDDWARLLKELAAWRQLPGASDFLLTLPDERSFTFLRAPNIGDKTFSGFVRPLAADQGKTADPLLLRIAHDGAQRLRIDLRPLPPARDQSASPSEPADAPVPEPPSESSPPSSPAPAPAAETTLSPAETSPVHATSQP